MQADEVKSRFGQCRYWRVERRGTLAAGRPGTTSPGRRGAHGRHEEGRYGRSWHGTGREVRAVGKKEERTGFSV
jgi:hypothetical protein